MTFALYGITIYFQFAWDDVVYVTQNYRVQGLSYPRMRAVWTGTYLGHYAPIHHTFLAVVHAFSGLNPFGYHVAQLAVHAACLCLLYSILAKIESPRVALLAALLFAVHPTNIETVAWISETKSTVAFLFFLLSFWAFIQWHAKEQQVGQAFSLPAKDRLKACPTFYLALCAVFLVISVLAKINTVVAPAIFFLYEYWKGFAVRAKRIAALALLFLISVASVVVHLISFHGSEGALESSYYGGLGMHVQHMPLLLLFYVRMLLFPHPLSAWHMFRIYEQFTLAVAAGWILLLLAMWVVYRSNRRVQFWTLWFLVFLLPVLQIIPFPIWVAERYLYIPAIGLFVLVSRGLFRAWDRLARTWQRAAWQCGVCAILIAFAWTTHGHLPIWKNDLVLWEATAKTCPTSAYCHSNLALALLQDGQIERGVRELIRAVEIRPSPSYLVRLGDAYTLSVGDYRQAIIAYNMALQEGGRYMTAEFFAKMARAYIRAGQLDDAERAIDAGARIDPNEPTLLVANGFLQWKRGNLQQARNSLRRVLTITGQTSNASGFFYLYWGDPAEVGRLIADVRAGQARDGSSGMTPQK